MSGDVQPRKRKDKKRKKDDLGVEEPRGTAAVFGEGDVFMHSQHEHGTGGHWCAKIIFFSLLAVLVTLIGLIILENRGLTDLEASSVESRYTGVLEGWLEDAPDDGHHDEHTLELKHHDDIGGHDNDDEPSQEIDQNDEESLDDHEEADDHDDEVEQNDDLSDEDDEDDEDNEYDDDNDASENDEDDDNSEEQKIAEADEDDDEEPAYRRYVRSAEYQKTDDDDDDDNDEDEDNDDDLQKVDENDSTEDNYENDESPEQGDVIDQSVEDNDDDNNQSLDEDDDEQEQTVVGDNDNYDVDDEDSNEDTDDNDTREDEDEGEHEDENVDSEVDVEKLEKEISDEDAVSTEEPEQPESKEDDKIQEDSNEVTPEDDVDDEEEYLELDDIDEPLPEVEPIKVPAGKPLSEVEDETTFEKPQDTLAEEEEYEKQQEEMRREKAEASNIWLKLVVGGALLAATHAVVRRATASRDVPDDHASREETPVVGRRMTLIPEEAATPVTPTEDLREPVIEEEILEMITSSIHTAAPVQQESEEEEDDEEIEIETKELTAEPVKDTVDKELYSDEEEENEDEEEEIIVLKKETPKQSAPVTPKSVVPAPEPEPEEEMLDDVEIIDDEQLEEEELGEEEEEDDISDVDDAELLSRLEAKYGRLPEPERPGQKHKDGGNSVEDDWPGEPSDVYWREQLDQAEQELRQGDWSSGLRRASAAELSGSARGKWVVARALEASADTRRDNALLSRAIAAYLDLLKMNERLGDDVLRLITNRTLDRIRFRGAYLTAEPVYRLLIRRFPDASEYRNNLTVTFLMANRADLAEESIKDTLKRWPDDRVALAHYGFVLKTQHNRLEEAVDAFQKALKDDVGPATEPRFYYHWGDSLLLLGRYDEAHEVHKRGAAHGHFLSPAQRSLYNVERLKSQPWWSVEQTPYIKLVRALEKSWKEILKEGEAARALYEKEKEGLKERGEWSQLDLFVRGQEVPDRCRQAPVTCGIVRAEPAASGCRRGQVKFSAMQAGTHVRPHVGPTNCRLRMHLALSNTKDTYIRVDQEIRQWKAGKVLMFDDSFEHEVWHNGTGSRLVLIVDVWHPDLAPAERRALPAI